MTRRPFTSALELAQSSASMLRLCVLSLCLCGCGFTGYEARVPQSDADDPTPACEVVSPADYCTSIPALPRDPVIDGVVDCGLTPRAITPAGWYAIGEAPFPEQVNARFASAWRPNGLYIYVEVDRPGLYPAPVADGLLYCGDAAELYLDADGAFTTPSAYDDPGTRQFVARAPEEGDARSSIGEVFVNMARVGTWDDSTFATFPREGGYTLEGFVTMEDLGVPAQQLAASASVGLNVGVNVATLDGSPLDCAHRLGQFFLRARGGEDGPCFGRPYCDTRAFCVATLTP